MSSCLYTHNGVTMNQQQLFEAIMQEILNDAENKFGSIKDTLFKSVTQADTVATLDSIQKQGKGKTYRAVPGKTTETGWIGVSEYMEQFHDLGKVSLSGDQINSLLFPIYNMNARIETMYKQERMLNPDESRPKEEIMELIRTQLADEKLGTRVGSIFHDIIAVILDKGKDSAEFQTQLERTKKLLNKTLTVEEKKELNVPDYITTLLQLMTSDVPGGLTEQQALDIFVDRASRLAGRIKAEHPGAKFYSEMDMCTDKAVAPNGTDGKPLSIRGLHGRSDLVIAEADGTTTVLDFKVATRHYDDWCAAKRYHTEYQLGFYRHILAANGIDGATTKLLISPIFMKRGDLTALELDGDGPDGALPKNVLTPTRYNASRLDWEFGQFTENIRKMVNIPFSVSAMESSELSGKINESFGEMVTYTPKDRFYGKQEFLDRWVNSEKRGGVDEWVFYDWSNHNKRVAFKDKEDFIKDGGFIDQFNDRIKKLTHSQVKEIIRQIEEARKEGTKHSDIDFLQSRGSNSSVAKHLSAAFGIYAGDQYQLVDAPILMEYGIIAYENTTTHTIYFEVLTDQHLQAIVDNNGQTTVLGNHYSNDEVRRLKGIDAMEAKCGNMELLKALHVINLLYQEHPESFANKKIGQIEVVNAAFGERHSVSMEQLISNYSLLASKVGIKNNFSGGKIKTSDLWEAMIADVNKAIIDAEEDKDLKQILSTLKGTTVTKSERLKQIETCIKKMKARYTDLRFVDFKDKRTFDLDNPVHVAYLAMVETYDYLLGIPVTYNGEISKWGLHFGEVIKILTLPFIKDLSNTLNNGYTSKGLGSGIEMSSPQTVPSATLRALYQYYDIAFIEVRQEYAKARATINKITQPYIQKKSSTAFRAMVGTDYSIWENLLVKDSEGKISKEMMLRNPYQDKTLSKEDSDFLKAILWEINKYKPSSKIPSELRELNYIDDSARIEQELKTNPNLVAALEKSYFELPLRRANDFLRLKNLGRIGISEYFTKKLKQGADEYDPRLLHSTHTQALDSMKKDSCEMYNAYDLNVKQRQDLIEAEGVYDFETDLDFLVSDVAFQAIRKNYFEKVLIMTDTVASALHLVLQTTDRSHETEIEGMDDLAKVLKGDTLIKNELKDVAKGIGALKRLNSFMVLALRPAQFIKELTFGQITNYSRAWALKNSSNAVSAKSVFNANKVIWGQTLGHYGDSFAGKGDLADYTMCEALNKVYGFANEDLNRTVENSTNQRKGYVQNASRYMYIANSAPDFFNRLTLFIAKMMEDGCWEAHTLNADGTLNYDFTKDKRFSELKLDSDGYIIKPTSQKGLEQLGLYRAMAEDFEREPNTQLIYMVNGEEKLKPFSRAYTIKQRNSIKEVSDLAYGFYDHEAKSLIDHKFIGLVWKQFMTFWTAKVQLWFRGKPLSPGDNTSQGRFVQRTENGEKLWRRIEEQGNGTIVVYEVPDSELRPEEVGKLEPCLGWQGDYSEGLVYSIMGAFYDIFHADFKHLMNDKNQLANLKLALHDILIGIILYNLLKFIFSGGTNKMQDVHPTGRILLRAMNDVSPSSITSISWEPGFYTTLVNTKNDAFKLLSSDHDILKMANKRIGAIKDFTWDEEKS